MRMSDDEFNEKGDKLYNDIADVMDGSNAMVCVIALLKHLVEINIEADITLQSVLKSIENIWIYYEKGPKNE